MKKGFTLIELLAVIVLIAIILGMSAPKIYKIINYYNDETETSAHDILISATKEYLEIYNRDLLSNMKTINQCKNVSTESIKNLGLIKDDILDLIYEDQEFFVKVTLKANNKLEYKIIEESDLSCN